ncbi:MAG: hypothetical protein ACK56I_10250, partial [bacterium]
MRFQPDYDFINSWLERVGGKHPQKSPPLLLLPFGMRSKDSGLGRSDRLDLPLIPLKTPERQPQTVITGVDGSYIPGRFVAGEVGVQQADAALTGGDLMLAKDPVAFSHVGIGLGVGN